MNLRDALGSARSTALAALATAAIATCAGCSWGTYSFSVGGENGWTVPAAIDDAGSRTELGVSIWLDESPFGVGTSVYAGGDGGSISTVYAHIGIGVPLQGELIEGVPFSGVGVNATLGIWSWADAPEGAGMLSGISALYAYVWEREVFNERGPGCMYLLRLRAVVFEYGVVRLNDVVGDEDAVMARWRASYVHRF